MNETASAYVAFDAFLHRIDSPLGPAEGHGLLCGLLCSAQEDALDRWTDQLAGDVEMEPEDRQRLRQLAEETERQLDDAQFGFHLLLPGDDEPLTERALGLGEWCQGYLAGLGLGKEIEPEDPAVKEVLEDLSQISKVSVQPEDCETEEDESSYAELVEYVRVAVLMVKEQLRKPATPPPEPPPFLH
ncbi:MAG: YecA family protein [Gammaproteobacteria bacterium]